MKILFGVLHILVCVGLVVVVMMQRRKSGGFTGSFGGGGTQADYGGTWQRMSSLTKITSGFLVAFMVFSLIQVVMR